MSNTSRPNLLFILTDQMRHDALSCTGNPFIETPNIDRIAQGGVRFSNAVTASPICAPARAAMLSGLPIHATGCITNPDSKNEPREGVTTFDDLLTESGYTAEYVGNWHAPQALRACYQKPPVGKRGYREYLKEHGYEPVEPSDANPYISKLSGQPYVPDPMDHLRRIAEHGRGHDRNEPGLPYGRDSVAPEHTLTAMVANEAIDALKRLDGGPFSLTCSLLFPHDPLIVSEPYCDMVTEADMALPATIDDERHNTQYENFTWQTDALERKHARLHMARYFAAVLEVDRHVGRILDTLDELGLTDNTLVIFTTDHGEMLFDHGLLMKFVHYRESIGVPLLMRLPGVIEEGIAIDDPVCQTGLYQTIADFLNVEAPTGPEESLRPLIDGSERGADRIAVSQFEHWNIMAQTRDWKYVWSTRPEDVDMLFDLTNDPGETTNLLGTNPDRGRHLDQAAAMKQRLADWMDRTGHPWLEQVVNAEIR